MVFTAKYPGRCTICGGQIIPGQQIDWEKHSGAAHQNKMDCQLILSTHASGDFGLAVNINGHEFKPDSSRTLRRCARCGTSQGVAWIAGAGEALCYRHQDDY